MAESNVGSIIYRLRKRGHRAVKNPRHPYIDESENKSVPGGEN